MQITDNIHVIPDVAGHVYLIVDADGLTLIDAGLPRSDKKILGYIASLGKSAVDLKRILLTHSDIDHIGSLRALHKASGARTYASKIEADAIALGKSSRPIKRPFSLRRFVMMVINPLMKVHPFQVDEILADGQVLPVAGGLRVVDTAGHTPGHISFFAPASGVLFCGDSMVTDDQGIHGSRPGLTWDGAKAKEAVKRQAALKPKFVCSGHGPVVSDSASKIPA